MRTIVGVFVLCTIGLTGSAFAQTPDATTPANEGVCDVVQGGSPGLYGLCVAYCEAQDLDTEGKAPPSLKILANYRKRMQKGDPDMPCVQKPCDCWSSAELESTAAYGVASCSTYTNPQGYLVHIGITNDGPKNYAQVYDDPFDSNKRCSYVDTKVDPYISRQFHITPEMAKVCFSQIVAACPQ